MTKSTPPATETTDIQAGAAPQVLCRDCQAPLPPGTGQGFCPRCLLSDMEAALGDDSHAVFDAVPLRHMGKYELLEVLGRGGMGIVFRARHTETGAERALKMIAAGELATPPLRRRFLQEAGAASALHHPNIVTIHEVGSQDGMPFYVMDYVSGRTLADAVREKPMPAHAAAACMARIAAAIQHAHDKGVLHRDLKPSNILLDRMDEPRVTDFGLARHLGTDSSLTGSQHILGSPSYMSPEQVAGGANAVTAGVDVYALGALLYHLLTGRPPFIGESPQAVLRQVTDTEPVGPRRINPSIPRELETVTLKCLEKNPARRYASAATLCEELTRWLQGEPVRARPLSRAGRIARWARRNPALTVMGAVLLTGAVAGLGFILHSNSQLRRSDAEKSSFLTEKDATLADSLLWQAEFQRLTGKPGQREGSLTSVRQALKLPLTQAQRQRARNAAIAALALPDARFVPVPAMPTPDDPALGLADPNCTRYATATRGGKITITDLKSNTVMATHQLTSRHIDNLLCWSQDGQFIAFRYDGTRLGVMHWLTGPTFWSAEVWPSPERFTPNQVIFNPSLKPGLFQARRILHPDTDGSIVDREVIGGFVLHRVFPPEHNKSPDWRALGYSPMENMLAASSGSRAEIVIWNMDREEPEIVHTLPCRAVVQSLDWEYLENWLLAGDRDGRLTIWNPRTWQAQPPFEGHTQPILSSDTGLTNYRHASTAGDGTIRLWDRTAYRPVLTLPGNAWRLYFNRDESRVGPVTQDGRTGRYELKWPGALWTLNPPQRSEGVRAAAFHGNGFLLAALTGSGAVVWKTAPPSGHSIFISHEHPSALTFTPDGGWLAVASAEGLHFHAIRRESAKVLAAPVLRGSLHIMADAVADICFDKSGRLAALVRSDSGTIEVRQCDTKAAKMGKVIHSFPGTPATRCALSPDGNWLAAGSPGNADARVFDLETGNLAAEPQGARDGRDWLPAFSYDNKWLVFSGRTAHLLRTGNWKSSAVPVPPNQGNGRGAIVFATRNPGVMWLAATGADEEVHIFRIGEPLEKLAVLRSPQGGAIGSLTVSTHGTLAASVPKGEVQLWPIPVVRKELEMLGLTLDDP